MVENELDVAMQTAQGVVGFGATPQRKFVKVAWGKEPLGWALPLLCAVLERSRSSITSDKYL
jgi:hypothetical protein